MTLTRCRRCGEPVPIEVAPVNFIALMYVLGIISGIGIGVICALFW